MIRRDYDEDKKQILERKKSGSKSVADGLTWDQADGGSSPLSPTNLE